MSKKLLLLFAFLTLSFVRADDVADNALEEGEEIYLDPEVEEGQIDNLSDPTAQDDPDNETAFAEVE